MKKQENNDLKQVDNLEDQELKVQELLEVQGGEESDNDQDDCYAFQCISRAVSY